MTVREIPTDWVDAVERRRWEAEESETPSDPFTRALLETLNDPEQWEKARRETSMRNHPSSQVDTASQTALTQEKSSDPMDDSLNEAA